jgi:hypothetical protein
MPASGSLFPAGAGALIDCEVLVEMETVDIVFLKIIIAASKKQVLRFAQDDNVSK